jgi:hypothetical protein
MPFGSLAGSLVSSFLADRYSRVTAIQLSTILWVIGSMWVFPQVLSEHLSPSS